MSIVTYRHPFVVQLAKHLGIEDTDRLVGYTVEVKPNDVVRVTATYLANRPTPDAPQEFFERRFKLQELEKAP